MTLTRAEREAVLTRVASGEVSLWRRALASEDDPILRACSGRPAIAAWLEPDDSLSLLDAGNAEGDLHLGGFFDGAVNRGFTGAPDGSLLVECECGCGCRFVGRFDETRLEAGMLRCTPCTSVGHRSSLRTDG